MIILGSNKEKKEKFFFRLFPVFDIMTEILGKETQK